MKVYPDTKIYIACIAGKTNGGIELLHQLASHLLRRNVDAKMYYYDSESADPVHERYKKYHLPHTDTIDDAAHNILIVPEVIPYFLHRHKKIQKILWWLSVDNWSDAIAAVLKHWQKNDLFDRNKLPRLSCFADETITHWAQSEYARLFLRLNGVDETRIKYVSDYLNPVFLHKSRRTTPAAKKDIVLINPVKGYEFTKKLIDNSPDLVWGAISGMTPAEVEETLGAGKIYIDFGHHPGKDRIPREAAALGCCIITGKKGAAKNDIDIPIPDEFKFADTDKNIPAILDKIRFVMKNFASETKKFDDYRRMIFDEPAKFARDTDTALNLTPPAATLTAILQPNEKGRRLRKILNALPEFNPVFTVETQNDGTVFADDIDLISMDDAAFLYRNGRIEKFAILSPDEQEINFFTALLESEEIPAADCLIIDE